MENVMELSTATIAFGTIIGMGGAIGSFLLGLGLSKEISLVGVIFYISGALVFIVWLRRKFK